MESKLVLGGRFRVFEDGSINKVFDGAESPAKVIHSGKGKRYKTVTYYDNGKQRLAYVHRLVAGAFIPNPDKKRQVVHKDGDAGNNAVSNLAWATQSEITRHSYDNGIMNPMATATPCARCGTFTKAKDGLCPSCKLSMKSEAKEIDRRAELTDRFSCIDPRLLTEAERVYVQYASQGMTFSEIADLCNVSRQCVSAALLFAEKKSIAGIRIPKGSEDTRISLLAKISKKEKKLKTAQLALEVAEREYGQAKCQLEEFEKAIREAYAPYVDEKRRDSQNVSL